MSVLHHCRCVSVPVYKYRRLRSLGLSLLAALLPPIPYSCSIQLLHIRQEDNTLKENTFSRR
jgi:hypothetical protein